MNANRESLINWVKEILCACNIDASFDFAIDDAIVKNVSETQGQQPTAVAFHDITSESDEIRLERFFDKRPRRNGGDLYFDLPLSASSVSDTSNSRQSQSTSTPPRGITRQAA